MLGDEMSQDMVWARPNLENIKCSYLSQYLELQKIRDCSMIRMHETYCRPCFRNRASKLMSFRLCSKLWFLVLFLIEMNRPIFLVLKGETMVLNYGDRVRSPFNTKKIGKLISMRSKNEKSELQSKLKKSEHLKISLVLEARPTVWLLWPTN